MRPCEYNEKEGMTILSRLSPATRAEMIEAARLGVKWEAVAGIGGVSWQVLYYWIRCAPKEAKQLKSKEIKAFALELLAARADGQRKLVQRVDEASKKDTKFAIWLLERVHGYGSNGFGNKQTGEEGSEETSEGSEDTVVAEALTGMKDMAFGAYRPDGVKR